jgi:2'-5' RNA ligase
MRTFLAVELSKDVAKELKKVQETLRGEIEGVRWVQPGGIHLTLKFLGEVKPDHIEEIVRKAEEAVNGMGPFTIQIRGGGGFPNAQNPRVIWIGVEDQDGQLRELQTRIEREMEKIGFTREVRDYTPHLTLGRLRTGKRKGAIVQALKDIEHSELGTMGVEELILFQSELKPTGAEYTKLRTIPLAIL